MAAGQWAEKVYWDDKVLCSVGSTGVKGVIDERSRRHVLGVMVVPQPTAGVVKVLRSEYPSSGVH